MKIYHKPNTIHRVAIFFKLLPVRNTEIRNRRSPQQTEGADHAPANHLRKMTALHVSDADHALADPAAVAPGQLTL